MSKRGKLTDCLKLMKEWDYEKNCLEPEELTVGSGKKAWWLCNNEHSWEAMIANRVKGTGCPYCTGKKILEGFNDLHTCNPALTKEWDCSKNTLTSSQVTCGSRKSAWWICKEGHSWKAAVCDRSKGRNCPVCSNQKVLAGFNDLLALKPELAKEWAYEMNSLLPSQVTPGSEQKVWWKCKEGHSWKASICNRNAGSDCPYCTNRLVLAGYNDLQTLKPELAKEWDSEKNTLLPTQVTVMSNRKVWWKCGKGHSWETEICKRSIGIECPYCSNHRVLAGFNDLQTLRPDLAAQWDTSKNKLRASEVVPGSGKRSWWKCEKGHSWKASIASRSKLDKVYCPYCLRRHLLAGFNDLQTLNPSLADEWDYEKNELLPSEVVPGSDKKVWWKCKKGHSWKAQIVSRNRSCECPYCTGRLLLPGFNDLQTRRPDLANEWDYEKNVLLPSQVAVGSNKIVWWKCGGDHSWQAMVNSRSRIGKGRKKGCGCPYCADYNKKVLSGFNDLQTVNPKIAKEWDSEKNMLTPSQVTAASGKPVWWKCVKEGHFWRATIASRTINGNNCPFCSGQRALKGFNDLETLNPELAEEWDNEKNILTPSQVTGGSGKYVWWKCRKAEHSWRTTVADRHLKGTTCPYCHGAVPYVPRCVK